MPVGACALSRCIFQHARTRVYFSALVRAPRARCTFGVEFVALRLEAAEVLRVLGDADFELRRLGAVVARDAVAAHGGELGEREEEGGREARGGERGEGREREGGRGSGGERKEREKEGENRAFRRRSLAAQAIRRVFR